MTDIRVWVVTDAEDFNSLADVWDGLLQRAGAENSVYLTSEWLSTWWRHFGPENRLNVLVFDKGGVVVGAVPLMRTEHRAGMLRLGCLETVGALNCNYVWVVPPENRSEVMDALMGYVTEALAGGVGAVRLGLVPDDSIFLAMLRARIPRMSKLAVDEKTRTLAPYVALPGTWDEFYESLSGNRKKLLRRYQRVAQRDHAAEYRLCTGDSVESKLGEFFETHEAHWRSEKVRGCFSDPRMRHFYSDVAGRFLDRGWLHFSWLSLDGEMSAAAYGFVYNGRFYAATSARDLRYSRYRVGHLLHMFLIKDAIERGLEEFDFLQGAEPHKFHWTRSARRYQDVVIVKGGAGAGLRLKYTRAILRLCELRRYGLREMYYLRRMKKREEQERRRMGLGIAAWPPRRSSPHD
jgi:CelD/BcsL family acetyltransferase involved in cellulose biosynthesis